MTIRVSRFKTLTFYSPNGKEISKDVPKTLNQALVRTVDFQDYFIRIISVTRKIAESESSTLKNERGKYAGYLIPCSAVLSDENPNNGDATFAAYSLIVASRVCEDSFQGKYDLAPAESFEADMDSVFSSNFYYAVFQKSKLQVTPEDFDSLYFCSFLSGGLLISTGKKTPKDIAEHQYQKELSLKKNEVHPDFIYEIFVNLLPYTENPFLRFFYLYQTIEYLMSAAFKKKYAAAKAELDSETDISVTTLRDIIKKFNESTKEETRINDALQPKCPITQLQAEKILGLLSVDTADLVPFSGQLYKIRNIIFHDFQKIHRLEQEVTDLCIHLLSYLLEKKIM